MGPGLSLTVDGGCSSSLSFLEIRVFALHLLNHYDREVVYEVAWVVEMGYYFFLKLLVSLQCSLRPDVERVLCLFHVLQLAFPALDDILHFAGCCCFHIERAASAWLCL